MSKPIIHIGIGLVTDSPNPLEGNLLQLAGVCGERIFNQTLTPLHPLQTPSRYASCPEVWEAALQNSSTPEEVTSAFISWLTSFRSTPVAVCNTLDFLWLHTYLRKFGSRFPFGDRLLDVGTWVAAKQGGKNPERKWSSNYTNPSTLGKLDPVSIAKHRLFAVMQGVSKEVPFTKPKRSTRMAMPIEHREAIPLPPPTRARWAVDEEAVAPPTPYLSPLTASIERLAQAQTRATFERFQEQQRMMQSLNQTTNSSSLMGFGMPYRVGAGRLSSMLRTTTEEEPL